MEWKTEKKQTRVWSEGGAKEERDLPPQKMLGGIPWREMKVVSLLQAHI